MTARTPATASVYVYIEEPVDGPGMQTMPAEDVIFDWQNGKVIGIEVLDARRVTIDGREAAAPPEGSVLVDVERLGQALLTVRRADDHREGRHKGYSGNYFDAEAAAIAAAYAEPAAGEREPRG